MLIHTTHFIDTRRNFRSGGGGGQAPPKKNTIKALMYLLTFAC